MVPLLWVGLLAGSLGAGAALAGVLVVRRSQEPLVLLAGVASIALSTLCATRLAAFYDSPLPTALAGLIALAAVGGGFALVSALLAYLYPAPRTPGVGTPSFPGQALAILLADTESEEYAPADVTREIAELVDAGLPEPTIAITPFHYAAQKARYRSIGGRSSEPAGAKALAERLEARLDPRDIAGPIVVSAAEPGALARVVSDAAAAGYRHVAIAVTSIAEGFHSTQQRAALDSQRTSAGMTVSWTRPLWTSDRLATCVATRTLAVRSDPIRTGVALVVHGQPGHQERSNQAFDVQESAFANRVRTLICEDGIDPEHVRVCAAEWRDPGVTETVRHLATLGCERIIVSPVCHPFANLQTLIDIPMAARDARTDDNVTLVHVPPWGDQDPFAEVLAAELAAAARTV